MIDCLGFYMTRDGRTVEIVRILESQPLAEGYLMKAGFRDTFHLWNIDGSFNRLKETDRDIVRFMYHLTNYENGND
jgi:hypothetical protein